MRLFFCDPFATPLERAPLAKFSLELLARVIFSRASFGPGDTFVGPTWMSDHAPPKIRARFISWGEIRKLGEVKEIESLLAFNEAAINILEKDPLTWEGPTSIPRALSYGFLAPHTEDLPFLVAGLHSFLRTRRPAEVVLLGEGRNIFLAADCAKRAGIPVREKSVRTTNFLSRFSGHGKVCAAPMLPPKGNARNDRSPTPVVTFASKERSLLYLNPIRASLATRGVDMRIACSTPLPNCEQVGGPVETKSSVQKRAAQLTSAWQAAAPEIANLPHEFQGAKIARAHLRNMEIVWSARATTSSWIAQHAESYLMQSGARALLLNDPLEGSWIFSKTAERLGIPTLFYYSFYEGLAPTAAIWEGSDALNADAVLTINDRMAEAVNAKRTRAGKAKAVGSVLQPSTTDERAPPDSGLRALILSRHVDPALSIESKRTLFVETVRAAAEARCSVEVKCHPHEKREELLEQLKSWGLDEAVKLLDLPLKEAISRASLVISIPATSAVQEAIYAGKPVVLYGPEEEFDRLDRADNALSYRRNNAVAAVYEGQALSPALKGLLHDGPERGRLLENARGYANSLGGPNDGRAAERIADALVDLTNAKRQSLPIGDRIR